MCMCPYLVKHGDLITPVPCGKCPECRKRAISAWSFRLRQELKRSVSAFFLTLTYGAKTLPISESGLLTLRKSDVQNFIKRLRKSQYEALAGGDFSSHPYGRSIKYFACGEYGHINGRPHYHILLFNAMLELIESAWALEDDEFIKQPIGSVHFGSVTPASIGYTLKYMCKESCVNWNEFGDVEDRQVEFRLMSKGLGANYLTDAMRAWHLLDEENRMYCNVDGKKVCMPRFYKDRIYDLETREWVSFVQMKKHTEMLLKSNLEAVKAFGDDWEAKSTEKVVAAFNLMFKNAKKNRYV